MACTSTGVGYGTRSRRFVPDLSRTGDAPKSRYQDEEEKTGGALEVDRPLVTLVRRTCKKVVGSIILLFASCFSLSSSSRNIWDLWRHKVVLCTGTLFVFLVGGGCQLTFCLVKVYVVIDLWTYVWNGTPGCLGWSVWVCCPPMFSFGSGNVSDESCRSWFSFPLFRVNLMKSALKIERLMNDVLRELATQPEGIPLFFHFGLFRPSIFLSRQGMVQSWRVHSVRCFTTAYVGRALRYILS